MDQATIVGIDLAKRVFHLHGAGTDGSVIFRKKLTRAPTLPFLVEHPKATVVLEACASAHEWGREIGALGHEVKLIPPFYVKPFVKRQKNDAADAEAIAEAAARPTMRFVPVKTRDQQARAMLFRTRDLLIRQRTQLINALRGHLAEHGIVAPQGRVYVKRLAAALQDDEGLPDMVRDLGVIYMEQIAALDDRITQLDKAMRDAARKEAVTARLQTMPGLGPITAMAIESFAPPMESFRSGRDFAAWVGLVPRQHSTGGKQRLGKTSKMGQRDIRRHLISGALSVIVAATRKGVDQGLGWSACWGRSRAWWLPSRLQTEWRAKCGPC